MDIRLIVNPRASSVTTSAAIAAESALGVDHEVSVARTDRRGHATELAGAAVAEGMGAVAVLGGDGTLNEAANALVGSRTPLMPLPGGSTNIFCRTLGLCDDPGAAATALAAGLADGRLRSTGVGLVEATTGEGPGRAQRSTSRPRAFLCHTGAGWDAELVRLVERHARWKRSLGHALFVGAGVQTFLGGFDRRRAHLRVELGDGTTIEDGFFALVMQRDPYTYLGHRPFVVEPGNDDSTALTVAVLRTMRADRFAPLMVDALRGGGLRSNRWLSLHHDVASLEVHRLTSMDHQVDGDHLGPAEVLRFGHRRDALEVVLPRSHRPPP